MAQENGAVGSQLLLQILWDWEKCLEKTHSQIGGVIEETLSKQSCFQVTSAPFKANFPIPRFKEHPSLNLAPWTPAGFRAMF